MLAQKIFQSFWGMHACASRMVYGKSVMWPISCGANIKGVLEGIGPVLPGTKITYHLS